MNVLFIGDSIIRGSTGVNWVAMLQKAYPQWKIENCGRDGDTLTKVSRRLEGLLLKQNSYDIIVLLAGYNDLLIPAFEKKGGLFAMAGRVQRKKDYRPLDHMPSFERELQRTVEMIREHSDAILILMTLGCLNENPRFFVNGKRRALNAAIRQVGLTMDCPVADLGAAFDHYLDGKVDVSNYFIEGFFNTAFLDKWRCRFEGCADGLSQRRGLHLTIDGVHLNSHGARLALEALERTLEPACHCLPSDTPASHPTP